jgi:hypothetical protein
MKKRLNKKERNLEARKKVKKIKKLKIEKKAIINKLKTNGLLKRKAILTFLLVGLSFFSCVSALQKNQSLKYVYENEIVLKTALACSPGTNFINPDGGLEKCMNNENDIPKTINNFEGVNLELHKKIVSIIKDSPMEKMAADIAKRDKPVAAFLVGIAMKESKFGKYSPKKNGDDCFNYWGYRGKENTTLIGYSCFDNPGQAIKIVGDRIESMVKQGAKTPADMISWKCGSTCAGHDPESVRKWISDVAINYYQINAIEELAKK